MPLPARFAALRQRSWTALLALAACGALVLGGHRQRTASAPANAARPAVPAGSIRFELNAGQTDPRVKFFARQGGTTLFLTDHHPVLLLEKLAPSAHGAVVEKAAALRMKLIGARPSPRFEGQGELSGKSNYFAGRDPARWLTNVPSYARVVYREVWPGIDVVFHGDRRDLEYDFVIAPGAAPGSIKLRFEGADGVSVDGGGNLVVRTAAGDLVQRAPSIYQDGPEGRRQVAGRYRVGADGEVSLAVDSYDPMKTLVVDPAISYATYLGGVYYDFIYAVATDSTGNVYVSGQFRSPNFPATVGAFDSTPPPYSFNLGPLVFAAKFDPTLSTLLYATYLSGANTYSDVTDGFTGLAVDGNGNAYVSGTTYTNNFPTTPGAFQTTIQGEYNAFITKLNPTGSALVYSTFLGGGPVQDGSWNFAGGIAADSSGNAYVAGFTNSPQFPTTPGAFRKAPPTTSDYEIYAAKFDANGALVYATGIGPTWQSSNAPAHIAVDSAGRAYVTGGVSALSNLAGSGKALPFPVTSGAVASIGSSGPFLTVLNPTGTALVYSTYLFDGYAGSGIALGPTGLVYITGNAYSVLATSNGYAPSATSGPFLSVLDITKSGANALVYSSALGSYQADANGVAVDASGVAYVTGVTPAAAFPTRSSLLPKSSAYYDAFVAAVDPSKSGDASLLFSTYLGGVCANCGGFPDRTSTSVALGAPGDILVGGVTFTTGVPATACAYQPTSGGSGDGYVIKISSSAQMAARVSGDTNICPGQSATIQAAITGPTPWSLSWSDGYSQTPSSSPATRTVSPSSTTTYTVTNGLACGSATVTVNPVPTASITASGPTSFCGQGSQVYLTAVGSGGTPGPGYWWAPAYTYLWSTGATTATISVNPAVTTTYTVTVTDGNGCSSTTASQIVAINSNPSVTIAGPASAVDGTSTQLTASATGGSGSYSYLWNTGATTAAISPATTPAGNTIYSVAVTDGNGCGATAQTSFAVTSAVSQVQLLSSANPSTYDQQVTFTATVSDASPGSMGTPGGTVTFKDGQNAIGTPATLSPSGVATWSTSTLSPGGHAISAVYNGDGNFAASASDPLTQTVNAPPVYTRPSDQHTFEGYDLTFGLGSFTDPTAGPWSVVIAWGDGTTSTQTLTSQGVILGAHVYADDRVEPYPVTVTVTNALQLSASGTFHITVDNVPPSVSNVSTSPQSSDEGSLVTATATFTDPGVNDTFTCSIDFGDGSPAVPGAISGGSCTASHVYDDNAVVPYVITATVTDNAGGVGTGTTSHTVNNVPPTATFATPQTPIDEGSSFTLALNGPFDPSIADTTAGFTYAFDCGQGYAAATSNQVTCPAPGATGGFTVRGMICDHDPSCKEYTAQVSAFGPTAAFTSPGSVAEGSSVMVGFSNVVDPLGQGVRYAIDCAGGSLAGITFASAGTSPTASCYFDDGPAQKIVTGAIVDADNGVKLYSATIQVTDVAPVATLTATPQTVALGTPVTVAFVSPIDPSTADNAAGYHYAFDCSGAAIPPPPAVGYANTGTAATTSCNFSTTGPHAISGRILDKDDSFTDYTVTVAVHQLSFMTGGGSVVAGVTHGMVLHCDSTLLPNSLEINWGKSNKFHLENLTSAVCSMDPSFAPQPPVAPFDVIRGTGTGRLNNVPGYTVRFTFGDAGEPGTSDTAQLTILSPGGATVLSVGGKLASGNQQAHAY